MLNRIIIMGRLTRDPRASPHPERHGRRLLLLAVDRDFKNQNGEKETDFIDVVAWRNSAEFVSRYFTKGRMAVVEGRLQIRPWQDRDGNKRPLGRGRRRQRVFRGFQERRGREMAATGRLPAGRLRRRVWRRLCAAPGWAVWPAGPEAIRHPTTAAETSRSWAMTMTGSSRSDPCGPSLRAAARFP